MKKLILICLLSIFSLGASPKCPCPEGTQLLVKYRWEGEWVLEEGVDAVEILGDCTRGSWISEIEIKAVSLKSGQNCFDYLFDLPVLVGDYSNAGLDGKDISNIQFCKANPTSVKLVSFLEREVRGELVILAFLFGLFGGICIYVRTHRRI